MRVGHGGGFRVAERLRGDLLAARGRPRASQTAAQDARLGPLAVSAGGGSCTGELGPFHAARCIGGSGHPGSDEGAAAGAEPRRHLATGGLQPTRLRRSSVLVVATSDGE